MTSRVLLLRSLAYYWRTNAAVVVGVAVAVSVLGGALVTGDSVRGTLRDLALQRLGATDFVVTSPGWFRDALATALDEAPGVRAQFNGVAPLAAAPGTATAQATGRRAGDVLVYGVDDRFWRFHGVSGTAGPPAREAYVSPALAEETGAGAGDAILVRVQRPSDVPLESLHGRKDDVGRTLRLTVARVLAPDELGEFSVQPTQASVRAVFVPLGRLQTELEVEGRVNTLLVSASGGGPRDVEFFLKESILAEDAGLRVRALPDRNTVSIESDAGLIDAAQLAVIEAAVETTLLEPEPALTYLANTIQVGDRSIPYSLDRPGRRAAGPDDDRSSGRRPPAPDDPPSRTARFARRFGGAGRSHPYCPERLGRARAAGPGGRSGACRVLPLGGAGPAGDPRGGVRARRDRAGASRRSGLCAAAPRHLGRANARRVGSAVSDRPEPHPSG
jgi:hypothetical protein